MRIRLFFTVAAAVAALALLAGCSPAGDAPFDQQFIDMMVPHHEGALAMARLAQGRAERAEIKQMAEAIIRDQDREIAMMKGWRKSWYGSDQTPPMATMPMVPGMAGHGGHGSTMDMAADVDALAKAPPPFDRAFIDAMIEHHQSAIAAAEAARGRAQKKEINELAEAIITAQQREIDQMRAWRQAWFGAAGK